MQNRSFLSFFMPFLAFAGLAAISCWWTSESLFHSKLFGEETPKIVYWVVVICFYVIISLGTKWIIDSLNMQSDVSHRRLKLIGGLLIVVAFWIAVGLPTNAHTLLYNRSAKSVAQKELKWQEGQLAVFITDIDDFVEQKRSEIMQPVMEIRQLKETLTGEILHPDRPGFAKEAEEILQKIEAKLGIEIGSIPRIRAANSSKNEMNRLRQHYSNAIDKQLELLVAKLVNDANVKVANYTATVADAENATKKVKAVYAALDAKDEKREEVLAEARNQINNAYNVLDSPLLPTTKLSRDRYVDEKRGMPSNRLINVVEVVYKDYLQGDLSKKYDMPETKGLIYLILLSLLVDVGAFLFFNIAFKK